MIGLIRRWINARRIEVLATNFDLSDRENRQLSLVRFRTNAGEFETRFGIVDDELLTEQTSCHRCGLPANVVGPLRHYLIGEADVYPVESDIPVSSHRLRCRLLHYVIDHFMGTYCANCDPISSRNR